MTRFPLGTLLSRAFRLRCVWCGQGKLFGGLFRMHPTCTECGLTFERGPGYFLGSTYINYALTTFIITVAYLTLHFSVGLSNRALTPPLVAFVVLFPLFFFRYARALWLALDCFYDPSSFEGNQDEDDSSENELMPRP